MKNQIDPITNRPVPFNCQAEPPYPIDPIKNYVVCFSIRFPDMCCHFDHPDCDGEPSGHLISECGVFLKVKQVD